GVQGFVSSALAAAGAWWLAAAWPSLRQAWCSALAAVAIVLAWLMPTLGGVEFALALCLTAHRNILAGGAGLAAAWIVGAYYYSLDDSLTHKSLVLFLAGAVLGVIGWWALGGSGGRTAGADADSRADAVAASSIRAPGASIFAPAF